VLVEQGTRGFHVAGACELQLEVDPLGFPLRLQLRDLALQRLCCLSCLGSVCDLGLELGNTLVALRQLRLVGC
jgi:hypothetical protein